MYSGEYNACDVTLSMHTDCNDAKYFYRQAWLHTVRNVDKNRTVFLTKNRTVFLTK